MTAASLSHRPSSITRLIAGLLCTALFLTPASLLQAAGGASLTTNSADDTPEAGPGALTIDAQDGIEWLRDQKQYIARGDAIASQKGTTVRGDRLTAHYRDDTGSQQIYQLDADGAVVVNSRDSTIHGDRGVYYIDRKVAVVVGKNLRLDNPRLTVMAEDSLEYWEEKSLAVARGNAVVHEKENRIKAGVLTAFITPNSETGKQEISRIDATGGVHISTPDEIVTGREGVYEVLREQITVCGKVKITRAQNQLNGSCAVVDLASGRSRLLGDQERVKGLILRDSPPK